MKKLTIYDLDGTLSHLNNSFDFIYAYHITRKQHIRYTLSRMINFIVKRLYFISYVKRRKIMLLSLFYDTNPEDLKKFFTNHYKSKFLKSLTNLGKKAMKEKKGIIITGCTCIPARQIGDLFEMETISTTFKIENKRIKGINRDTFGSLKAPFFPKDKKHFITYYTDDYKSDKKLKPLVDEFVHVP